MEKNIVYAIILAAGSGSRMQADITKQKMLVLGKSIISRSVQAFYSNPLIDGIIVVGRSDELDYLRSELADYSSKITAIVAGGDTRFDSARIGFSAVPTDTDFVAIHDGARPLITQKVITAVVEAAFEHGAATDAAPVYDTVKQVDEHGMICATLDRDALVQARTPQVFARDIYALALERADGRHGMTDDNSVVEAIGVPIYSVKSDEPNPKITTRSDIGYAEYLLKERGE